MAVRYGKTSNLGDTPCGDQERDANFLLMELDKGLRSTKVGEQCEAIVRFPRLFEKYPFPILINSAFLKLADVFRAGSNFLRYCVLKVTQQSTRHLDKIINIDEFLRRIYTVSHSNDPVARAITLRTLGRAACIISERKNVHHSIINSLDSHDAVELSAAVCAANFFAAQSREFAQSICSKLTEMIECLTTPINMKLQLIPIFQHMYYDTTMIRQVRQVCSSLLESYQSRSFVQVALHTLSLLASKSLSDIPRQVELLLRYLKTDCRSSVRLSILQDLAILARKGPHMWTKEYIQALCGVGSTEPSEAQLLALVKVLVSLSSSVAVDKLCAAAEDVKPFCDVCCYHSDLSIASEGASLLTNITLHQLKFPTCGDVYVDETTTVLNTLLTLCGGQADKHSHEALKTCLCAVVRLGKADPSLCDDFSETLMANITQSEGEVCLSLCQCLASLGSSCRDVLTPLLPPLLQVLGQVQGGRGKLRDKTLVLLATLLFQACVHEGALEEVKAAVASLLDATDGWSLYQVARQAARYGHHQMAALIYKRLTNWVSSEHFHFWLSGLKELSHGEACLQGAPPTKVCRFIKRVSMAQVHFHNSVSSLKASATPNCPMTFQIEYVQLRAQMMQVHVQTVRACCSFQTSPPPAIATSLAMTTGQENHRSGHVVTQLTKCVRLLEELCQGYDNLYKASFDADQASLTNLQLLKLSVRLLISVTESVLKHASSQWDSTKTDLPRTLEEKSLPLEHQLFAATYRAIQDEVQVALTADPKTSLTYQHIACIQNTVMGLSAVPLSIPRYFCQRLQSTDIKLAVSPQAKTTGDPISVHFDTCLTLKVEGVVQHGTRAVHVRHVRAVRIKVKSALLSKGPTLNDEPKGMESPTNEMTQSAQLHNDYFSTDFLFAFPVPGLHQLHLAAFIEDDAGFLWTSGARMSLSVKSYDEAVQQQQQQQYAAQRQQQRAAQTAAGSGF